MGGVGVIGPDLAKHVVQVQRANEAGPASSECPFGPGSGDMPWKDTPKP